MFRNTYSRTHYALSRTELPIHSGSAKLLAFLGIVCFTTSLIVNIFAQAWVLLFTANLNTWHRSRGVNMYVSSLVFAYAFTELISLFRCILIAVRTEQEMHGK